MYLVAGKSFICLSAIELVKNIISTEPLKDRLIRLCNGASLPTDNQDIASKVLNDLITELKNYKINYKMPNIPLDSAKNINLVRDIIEEKYRSFQGRTVCH